jgi:hypothetical protein
MATRVREFAKVSVIMQISACLMELLILFDLDGTLTRTQKGYVPFNEAIHETFGVVGDIRSVIPDGNTDPQIVREIFAKANVEKEIDDGQWEQFAKNLWRSYSRALRGATTTVHALPGARNSLLRKSGAESGRGYRKFRVTAQIKLTADCILIFAAALMPAIQPIALTCPGLPKSVGSSRQESLFALNSA